MMRLCFGTFAHVLRLCKRQNVTDYQLVGTMTRTVDPNCQYLNKNNKTSVSRLLSCTSNLSSGRKQGGSRAYEKSGESISNVVAEAQKANKKDVVQKFEYTVIGLLDEDKKEQAINALLDIIEKDTVIENDKKLSFQKYIGKTKNALLSQDEFVLSELLTGLFLYTAAEVVNTVGKECIKDVNTEYLNQFNANDRKIKIINISNDSFRESAVTAIQTVDELVDFPEELPVPFQKYLFNVKQKYSLMKTLLYNDHPKPFYDFYVCNNIERRVPVTGRFGTSYKTTVIANVNFKSLSDCSRFVILSGTGGLGKSMMMRHLLLDSIENYSQIGNIPIFIPLKDFDETTGELFEYVFSRMKNFCTDITEKQFQEILSTGKCLLLFDGLDEIASANAKKFERELERFTDMYPDNYYVISSRPTQSFISYSRFTVMHLKPFSTKQALKLIDNLEFRPDEPIIKEKFRLELEKTLYHTHRSFIENPLLLTIMLITFEQYAEVPSKMHIFYREAYAALSIKHDASKGAYKRTLKTGLTADKFADYFAEICSRSYYDEKFEMNEDEFTNYYKKLSERKKYNDQTTNVIDYLYDLCSNMCLMYFESGKYHFTHRSFQEYFCALYFSKQKDKHLESIADFFEHRRNRMYGDKTFNMLYDMISEKVEEYMFLPYLAKLYERCDNEDGYWTFLQTIYPCIQYERGETDDFSLTSCQSYLFSFIKELNGHGTVMLQDLPHYDSLVSGEYAFALDENENEELVNLDNISYEYKNEYGTPDIVGRIYEFEIDKIRNNSTEYTELIRCIENDNFVLKKEYNDMRLYLEKLKNKQTPEGNSLFDMF
ncbi:NACHT domain-containing NTPase [Haloimpatiens sp. FM7315]|uniref:NACHT domain-containing protein n=1 Tax=Haloimpatiens sp. FM7315 TaxID=3298609 RepID=UPI0035A3B590